MSSIMTESFLLPTSYDVDDATYDVNIPDMDATLEEFNEFERLQKSDPLNIAFSIVPRFKYILDVFAPSLGPVIERPEYRSNIDFQFKAMKLCFYGIGYKFSANHPNPMFHLTEIINEIESVDPEFFLSRLLKYFKGGEYLLTRSWYCKSPLRQLKTMILAMTGIGHEFFAVSGDFDYELNRLLRKGYRQNLSDGYDGLVYLDAVYYIYENNRENNQEEDVEMYEACI